MTRKTIFAVIALPLLVSVAWAEDGENLLFLQPEVGYHAPRVFARSQSAGYAGFAYGGSIYYKIGDDGFAFAPVASYTLGSFSSTADTATQSETFRERTFALGVKLYFGSVFVKANYAWVNAKDESKGVTNSTISDSANGFGGSIGAVFPLSGYVKLEVSADVQNVSFQANPQAFTTTSQYLRFGGTLGIAILLPSSNPHRIYRMKTSSPVID